MLGYSKAPKRRAGMLLYLPFCCKIVCLIVAYHGEEVKLVRPDELTDTRPNTKSWKIHCLLSYSIGSTVRWCWTRPVSNSYVCCSYLVYFWMRTISTRLAPVLIHRTVENLGMFHVVTNIVTSQQKNTETENITLPAILNWNFECHRWFAFWHSYVCFLYNNMPEIILF